MFCFQLHARAYCTMNEKFSILHEAKLKFGVHCAVSKCVYLKTKHELTVSNPFNVQFESTAGDRLTMASHPTCLNEKTMNLRKTRSLKLKNTAQFLCVFAITHSVTLMWLDNGNSRDQF